MPALTVLSVLICVFGLLAGASNVAAITFIAFTAKLRKLTFGKLLLNLAVSGGKFNLYKMVHKKSFISIFIAV